MSTLFCLVARHMEYPLLRTLHIATVQLSLALFLLRGFWMLTGSQRLHARWARTVPHINDSLLLTAAIAMLVFAAINPLEQPWLLAKIVGLLAYIGLGTLALKRGKTKTIRVKALIAAIGMFGYIIAVAITKQVIPGVA